MQRIIKFRGKRCDKGNFVYGSILGTSIIVVDFDVDECGYYPGEYYSVTKETIGQYTGLKDKNDVEIYEGDIIEAWSEGYKARGEVKQRIDGYWLMYPAWQSGKSWAISPYEDGTTEVVVVGNIYENK